MHRLNWNWRRTVESPWFYAVWFCLFGSLALLVAAAKYNERQSGIERRFQARSMTNAVGSNDETPMTGESTNVLYSSAADTVIPLWPLGWLLAILSALAAILAVRAGRPSQAVGKKQELAS